MVIVDNKNNFKTFKEFEIFQKKKKKVRLKKKESLIRTIKNLYCIF